jgi:hypothetical protein|tara:strand:+ start:246 stop:674 length:429 start_codon:yes stop_codon:yes gene_type:complete
MDRVVATHLMQMWVRVVGITRLKRVKDDLRADVGHKPIVVPKFPLQASALVLVPLAHSFGGSPGGPCIDLGLLAGLGACPFVVPAATCLTTVLMVACALLKDLVATPVGTTDQAVRIEVFVAFDHGECEFVRDPCGSLTQIS